VGEAIEPLLAAGSWVLLDRFVDSSLAYQGAGRALGVDLVRDVNLFATGGLRPDRTLLLEIEPALGRARTSARGEPVDRLELERDEFFQRIAAAYRELADQDPERFRVIDATQSAGAVVDDALRAIEDLGA
jgi:dTMP kinase